MTLQGPIVGILLAAGRGSRFGSDKLLHPLSDGTPLALAAAHNLLPACDQVLAVVRPDSDILAQLLRAEGYSLVVSTEAHHGMGHSLAAGVRAAPHAGAWIVALADMPFIAPSSHHCIAEALRAGASIAAPIVAGRRGHPVGFARPWYDRLAALSGEQGARSILAACAGAIVQCEVEDRGVLRDVDTPADLTAPESGHSAEPAIRRR